MFARGNGRGINKICSATIIWLFDAILHIISSGYSLHIRLCWYTYSSVSAPVIAQAVTRDSWVRLPDRALHEQQRGYFFSLSHAGMSRRSKVPP